MSRAAVAEFEAWLQTACSTQKGKEKESLGRQSMCFSLHTLRCPGRRERVLIKPLPGSCSLRLPTDLLVCPLAFTLL